MGPEVAAATIAAGGGLASGIAAGLMQPDQKKQDRKLSMPSASPGQVGSRPGGGNMYSGRPDIAGPQPRSSLAQEMLKGGYR